VWRYSELFRDIEEREQLWNWGFVHLPLSRRRESIALREMRHCPSIFSASSLLSQTSAYTCLRLTPSRRAASRTLTASLAFNFIPPQEKNSLAV
jgi:hypothetical protein